MITVKLRDSPDDRRFTLLHVPTSFTISAGEVNDPIAAGRDVLHGSPDFQALVSLLAAQIVTAGTGVETAPADRRMRLATSQAVQGSTWTTCAWRLPDP